MATLPIIVLVEKQAGREGLVLFGAVDVMIDCEVGEVCGVVGPMSYGPFAHLGPDAIFYYGPAV